MNAIRPLAPALALLLLAPACQDPPAPAPAPASASTPAAPPPTASVAAPASASTPASAPTLGSFGELVRTLSEPGGEFFSDNLISNETSYLQVAGALSARPEGGVYIGVGPEQNFTYIALTRPRYAFIVDIRRDNLLQQLWYKALFEGAESRAHFLALMLGRPHDAAKAPPEGASIDEILSYTKKNSPDEKLYTETLTRVTARIEGPYGVALDGKDKQALVELTRAFFDKGLDLRFELKESSSRRYPSLGELFAATDPQGKKGGFLASDEAFRLIKRMHGEGRIVPLVGNFAGDGALPALAALLRKNGLSVSTFYVSNVEQYLLDPPVWSKWLRNVKALPAASDAVFVRCYLDQGKKHPRQMDGHRTATVLQRMGDFVEREEKSPSRSFWKISTEGVLE
ncbi:hypothetical protein [Polyangium aurulentum]|uniref:LIC_10091 family protein n=1 Tax=Polyangium aurulentum TaxID=2567896 RepID=UPI0010AE0E06|nr:hypothetical protein [Polyangium aurulentum]UQA57548.1 hypothetical protein E8A73_040750 [Polyangium aurulentum]